MNRLARGVAQLLEERPGDADQIHVSGIGAAEFEQSRAQRIGACFRMLFDVLAPRQRLKQAVRGADIDAGRHRDLGYRGRTADGAKMLEDIEHLGDRLDCRAFQFSTNGANHSGLRSSQFTNDVGSTYTGFSITANG